jgi:signal transduction histidine kinase
VGAIRSARDTLARAVARLREGIPSGPALQAIDGATSALESATDRLGTILSGFKSFSHLDEAEWQIARLEEGLDSTVALMDSQLQGQITVEKEYGGIPAIWCTPARLNQVFMHLITNALQAMDGPGTLRLRTWVEDDRVCVGIRDSGVGIPAEQLGGLFDVAFRRRARVKMGMGLVADSHTVSEHGGKMHVHSKVGVGTEVIIRLPLRQRE